MSKGTKKASQKNGKASKAAKVRRTVKAPKASHGSGDRGFSLSPSELTELKATASAEADE